MAAIISTNSISKQFGSAPLFENISFTVSDGDRIGLIGPNGSGKSTLLSILAGTVKPDSGEVSVRKGTRLAVVAQVSDFAQGETVGSVIDRALQEAGVPHEEHAARIAQVLGRAGLDDVDAEANTLSGGWRKRLAIAAGLVQEPDVLLLDEPTNHLDLAGIAWLEALLQRARFACVVVSHDRYFLENVVTDVIELNRTYTEGSLRVKGNYSTFLEAKEQYLHAQRNRHEALENLVHTEIEWLRRGPKARTTKSKSRIGKAHKMIGELAELNERSRTTTAKIDFAATERQTKQLVVLDGISYAIADRTLFRNLQFTITAGMRVGLVGPNGSGKTTLLRLLRGDIEPASGAIRRAQFLRIVYFDQNRQIDPNLTLKRALAPDSDSVIYQDRTIHVGAWAARFLFSGEDLNRPVSRLSGGERARVLIAQLMLQPADVLLLDEPTNDLDIPTLEVLEQNLLEFPGALVLVTHDRYMLDRVSTVVLGLDGSGTAERFADYSQWEEWKKDQRRTKEVATSVPTKPATSGAVEGAPATLSEAPRPKKLSFRDTRDFETIEQRIADAEKSLHQKVASLNDPEVLSDAARLREASLAAEQAQKAVEELYARWAELEEPLSLVGFQLALCGRYRFGLSCCSAYFGGEHAMPGQELQRAFRIGIAGPVGSGKTALADRLSRKLWPKYNLAVVTNDIYTKEDAEFLLRQGVLPADRVRGVETGGCPHAAIREDASMNLQAIAELENSLPGLELIFVESGGDNLSAAFSPDLVDAWIYVIDVAEGDKIPRKGGPGITRSDLLLINKIDLAPYVGASLEVMERDSKRMRGARPFLFTNLREDTGLQNVIDWLEEQLKTPVSSRHAVIDAHGPYVGRPHSHDHSHTHSHGDGHTHSHEHDHDHSHPHGHDHDHAHGHSHSD